VPTTLPQKLYDPEVLDILESAEKVWIQTHFNHPREVTPEVARVCKALLKRGMPLNNHTVLMKGINDDLEIMRKLMRALLRVKIRPYYLFHCDPVTGRATSAPRSGRAWRSWKACAAICRAWRFPPTYCVDAPHGGGKIPLLPNYSCPHPTTGHPKKLRRHAGSLSGRGQVDNDEATANPVSAS